MCISSVSSSKLLFWKRMSMSLPAFAGASDARSSCVVRSPIGAAFRGTDRMRLGRRAALLHC
eukprot:6188682-Pleurochrysis_carterae.AAC.1